MCARTHEVDGDPLLSNTRWRPLPQARVSRVAGAVKKAVLETAGWMMFLGGLAAIPLPGPGLLMTFAGLLLLSRRHSWAERRVEMVRSRALQGAVQSVATWQRVVASTVGAVMIFSVGVAWIASPTAPQWWPLTEAWWLPGGPIVGVTQVASAVIALTLLGYSFRRFRRAPEPPAAIVGDIADLTGPSKKLVAACAIVRPDCLMGECDEVLCRCLCTSAA